MPADPPAIARRRLRLKLRSLRDAKGVTQTQVSEALDWSLSKVIRIERGDVTISGSDVRALLAYYGVHDVPLTEDLIEASRASRVRNWWTQPHIREHLTRPTLQLLELETEATTLRCFQPTLVPGIFQIPEYAAAVMNVWEADLSASTRNARLELRARRFAQIFDRGDPPQYFLVLDESVVWRQIGGAAVAAAQLHRLLELADREGISIRIWPFETAGAGALIGSFLIIDLDDDAVLYRESHQADQIEQTPSEVARHRHIFEEMWQNALSEDATARLIAARSNLMLASLDRPGAINV
jgi:transcriptional regulator with XRE-family HTH domain